VICTLVTSSGTLRRLTAAAVVKSCRQMALWCHLVSVSPRPRCTQQCANDQKTCREMRRGSLWGGPWAKGVYEQDYQPVHGRSRARGPVSGTIRGYENDLELFARWFEETNGEELSPRKLTAIDIQSYPGHLQTVERRSAATINRRLGAIRRLCRWAKQRELIRDNPADGIRCVASMKGKLGPKGLSRREVNALLREAQRTQAGLAKRNTAILQLLLQAGLRLGELAGLQVQDVEIHDRSGTVRIHKGKAGKQREVPLNSSARTALRRYLEVSAASADTDPLFVSQRGRPMSARAVQHLVQGCLRAAALEGRGYSTHSLRHTFSLNYLDGQPGDLVGLAAILGHQNLNTTAVYTRPTREQLSTRVEESSLNVYGE